MTIPSRIAPRRLATVGAAMLCICVAGRLSQQVPLPRDEWFGLLVQLMWQGTYGWGGLVLLLFDLVTAAVIVVGVAFLIAAILGRSAGTPKLDRFVLWWWPYALSLAMLNAATGNLGRYVANAHYLVGDFALLNLTGVISRMEGPLIVAFQRSTESGAANYLMAVGYSFAWMVAILLPVPYFVWRRHPQATSLAVVGPVCLSLLALPLHAAFPVYDPWSLNPAYGNPVHGPLAARFLFPNADSALLSQVVLEARRVVGACFPSLHVALPAYFGMVALRTGFRGMAAAYGVATGAVVVSTVYLGRHWVVDGMAGVVFAWGVLALIRRWRLSLALSLPVVGGQ